MLITYIPVQKGNKTAFTCLGNWYDLADVKSFESLMLLLKSIRSKRDYKTAINEIFEAINNEHILEK